MTIPRGTAIRIIQLENRIQELNTRIRHLNRIVSSVPMSQRGAIVDQINALKAERGGKRAELSRLTGK
jgi:hypothetical protein